MWLNVERSTHDKRSIVTRFLGITAEMNVTISIPAILLFGKQRWRRGSTLYFCVWKCFIFDGITGLIEIYILSTNSMSVRGTFNHRGNVLRKVPLSIVKRFALDVEAREVHQSTNVRTKLWIGWNILHKVGILLSQDILGGLPKP